MDRKENLKNYISKISCFVTCIRSNKWIKGAGQEYISMLFEIANDIEMTVKKFKSSKFDEKLGKLHPNVDLSRSTDLLLGCILKYPGSEDSIVVESIKQYLNYHSDGRLSTALRHFLTEKKLKDHLIVLNQTGEKTKSDLKILEAKSIFPLWEELLSFNNDNLKKIIIELLNNKSGYLLSIMDSNPENENSEKMTEIIVNFLNVQGNAQLWGKLLADKNIDIVISLCDKHGKLLDCVLNFFEKFGEEVEEEHDEDFNVKWKCKDLGFDDFVKIVGRFLREGEVKKRVDEFLVRKRNDFDCNFLFWVEVSSCV